MARLRVDDDLRRFLASTRRNDETAEVTAGETDTVGHVVEAAGIPLTEVGRLDVDGRAVGPRERVPADATIAVHVRPRPQPLDGPARLLLDVHLGALARRLRLLGLDVAYRNDATDDELVARAETEDRLLLTRDRGLLRRRALRRAAYVRGDRVDDQVTDVLDRFRLPLAPFTRCVACGGRLDDVVKSEVMDRLEPGTRRTQDEFSRCVTCERLYWRGAHWDRLRRWVESVT